MKFVSTLTWTTVAVLSLAGTALRGAESGSQVDRGSAPSEQSASTGETRPSGGVGIDRGDTSTFWMSEEAAADSVASFWGELDHGWLRTRDAHLDSFGLDQARLDSLVAEGDERIAALAAGRLWRFSWGLFDWTAYNRVQGFNPGVSVGLRKVGPNRPRLEAGLGYGFGNKRIVGGLALDLPLVIKRRQLPHGMGRGRPYQFLSLELEGYRKARMFGGDDRRARYLTSFIYGSDPNQYYQPTGGRALLRLRAAPWLRLRAAYRYEEHEALAVTTEWNLFNWPLSPPGNLPADDLRAQSVIGGLSFSAGVLSGSVDASWNRVDSSAWLTAQPGAPEQGDFWRTRAGLKLDLLEGHGHRILLQGRYRGVNRVAPTQWRTYLGDYGTLRGYAAGELSGDQGAWASLDIRWGFDLWRALHVPWLKGLGLQTITFADWGQTWNHSLDGVDVAPPPDPDPAEGPTRATYGTTGWRMDAGIGFGKLVGVPGHSGNLRLYISHQILDGQRDAGWRVLLALEN